MTVRIVWSSLVGSNALIVGVGMVSLAGITDPAVLDPQRLVPADMSAGAVIWALGFASLGASFVVPGLLTRSSSSSSSSASSSSSSIFQRAYTPFILSMALAESCTLMGLVSAVFMGAQVPERMLLPAAAAILAGLSRFPTEGRFRALAGDTR
jgi:hypothetical protein